MIKKDKLKTIKVIFHEVDKSKCLLELMELLTGENEARR